MCSVYEGHLVNVSLVRGCKCTCGSFHVGVSDASQLTISDVAENIPGKRKTSYSNCAKFHDPNVVSFFSFFSLQVFWWMKLRWVYFCLVFKSEKLLELGPANVLG